MCIVLYNTALSSYPPDNHLKPGFHSNARNARIARNARNASACVACDACVAWKIESILSLRFLAQGPLAWLALAYFCFCLRNFLAFVAFLAHFLFCLRTFPYVRPCVRCVPLNGNQASAQMLCTGVEIGGGGVILTCTLINVLLAASAVASRNQHRLTPLASVTRCILWQHRQTAVRLITKIFVSFLYEHQFLCTRGRKQNKSRFGWNGLGIELSDFKYNLKQAYKHNFIVGFSLGAIENQHSTMQS